MRLGRIISSLCCVKETDKTITPFPENRFLWVLFAHCFNYLDLEDESCSLSSIETRLLGFPGPSQLARLLPEVPVSCWSSRRPNLDTRLTSLGLLEVEVAVSGLGLELDWRDRSLLNSELPRNPLVTGSGAECDLAEAGVRKAEAVLLWFSPSLRSLSLSSNCSWSSTPADRSLSLAEAVFEYISQMLTCLYLVILNGLEHVGQQSKYY